MKSSDEQRDEQREQRCADHTSAPLHGVIRLIATFAAVLLAAGLLVIFIMFVFFDAHF